MRNRHHSLEFQSSQLTQLSKQIEVPTIIHAPVANNEIQALVGVGDHELTQLSIEKCVNDIRVQRYDKQPLQVRVNDINSHHKYLSRSKTDIPELVFASPVKAVTFVTYRDFWHAETDGPPPNHPSTIAIFAELIGFYGLSRVIRQRQHRL